MGVINVTPDSFSGDGVSQNVDEALALVSNFKDFGVDIIDIGGESTRPSSIYNDVKPLTIQEEISRVVPVISQIKKHFDVPISIDSRRAVVVREAFDAGADMINDVSMMNYDSDMINVVSDLSIPFVLTHNRKIKNGNENESNRCTTRNRAKNREAERHLALAAFSFATAYSSARC